MSKPEKEDRMPRGRPTPLAGMIRTAPGAVVSRTLVESSAGTVTLFAFDAGEGLSEHAAPYDAFVHLLEGELDLTLGGAPVKVSAGEAVLMPANVPHALRFPRESKMLLVMVRG